MRHSRRGHVAALLRRSVRQRKLLEGEVRGLAAELQALRRRLQEAQLDAETPAAVTTMFAAALINRQRYQAVSEARIARLVEDVGQAERRLRERRVALQQAAQQALVWEKLAARLEQRRVDLERRLQQEIIDQHGQARHRDRSI